MNRQTVQVQFTTGDILSVAPFCKGSTLVISINNGQDYYVDASKFFVSGELRRLNNLSSIEKARGMCGWIFRINGMTHDGLISLSPIEKWPSMY